MARLIALTICRGVAFTAFAWFADEARIGQKNKITRRWAKKGIQGTEYGHIATFSRNTAGPSAPFIPIGATIESGDGTVEFEVTVDLGNPNYVSSPEAGYVMPANIASITVPVQCLTVGTAGKVAAGALSQITTPLTGIDTVVNAAKFNNGFAAESDPAYRSRFIGFIAL